MKIKHLTLCDFEEYMESKDNFCISFLTSNQKDASSFLYDFRLFFTDVYVNTNHRNKSITFYNKSNPIGGSMRLLLVEGVSILSTNYGTVIIIRTKEKKYVFLMDSLSDNTVAPLR